LVFDPVSTPIANTISLNYRSYFWNIYKQEAQNASAESFNDKNKKLLGHSSGVEKCRILLYRLTTIFA